VIDRTTCLLPPIIMDWSDLIIGITWVCHMFVALFVPLFMMMLHVSMVIMWICEAIYSNFRSRRRRRRLSDLTAAAAAADDDDDRESCVICLTPYGAGDTWIVLPGSNHTFVHKHCVD